MFSNPYREILIDHLSSILNPELKIKSSTLLQAFATFKVVSEMDSTHFSLAYKKIFGEKPESFLHSRLSHKNLIAYSNTFLDPTINIFASLSPNEFFRYIIPDIVSNPKKTTQILQQKFSDNILLFAHHIIQINYIVRNNNINGIENQEDVLKRLYNIYTKTETHSEIRLKQSVFLELYNAIYLYPLDYEELTLRTIDSETKKLHYAIDILTNQLEIPRKEQIDILYRCYVRDEQPNELIKNHKIYNFIKNKDILERKKLMRAAILNLAQVSPLDALCAVSIIKKFNKKHPLQNTYIPNDITLENGLIYTLFTSYSVFNKGKEKDIFVFFPSPFFIRKWLADTDAKQKNTTFIMKDANVKSLIDYHYTEGTYANAPGDNIKFLDYSEWQERIATTQLSNANILLFARDLFPNEQSEWFRYVKKYSDNAVDIFALIPSFEFEHAATPFSAELNDPHIQISTVVTIPQGINNSTFPRRKIFLHCSFCQEPVSVFETMIHAFTLNTDLKTQALSKKLDAPVAVTKTDLFSLDSSIRELYRKELLERKASGRENTSAFSYAFTPDITVWCSKSYPNNNKNRPRLEAYICTPANPKRSESGYRNRGKAIAETKKRTTKIADNDVFNWLENEYPFSVVKARRSSEISQDSIEPIEPKPSQLSIREVIIELYQPYLEEKNIALKTLWYLHPEIESSYSPKEYRLFERIACSEIGFRSVADFSPEICEELLPYYFPKDSREDLLQKLKILSIALDKAVNYHYCEENLLKAFVQDFRKNNKLFLQVRNALTKKHFTESELLQAYTIVRENLDNGQMEYLGVMIRLLTGLDSNTVCALKWKDIINVPEYSFKKIVVTRQVTNDGKEIKGFDSLEDYLCFPCSLLLQKNLDNQTSKVKRTLPNWTNFADLPIVTTAEILRDDKKRYSAFPPSKLEQLCREVISRLCIPDHIIEIPNKDKGTKETNLNHYGGDFYRENFRYWALNKGKLNIDEVLYLIGNKPETTFGIFYCDFLNDASQLILFTKLLRLDTLFAHNKGLYSSYEEIHAQNHFKQRYLSSSSEPLQLRIRLQLPENCDSATLEATCQYGMDTYVTPFTTNSIKED